ncbi:MAG: hypothetical protein K6F86_07035 [Lachnospiraceae bacterium]|nr:hypothetical protein [Lachnospiraceae bacterium]
MKKRYFYGLFARLSVVFIILSSFPAYAGGIPVSGDVPAISENKAPLSGEQIPGKKEGAENAPVSEDVAGFSEIEDSSEEAAGADDIPRIKKLEIYIYEDKNNPDTATNAYQNANADYYGSTPAEDAELEYSRKKFIYFSGAAEKAPKIRFVVTPNRNDVEYEFERLNRDFGTFEYTTGRIAENYYVCEHIGDYRIHIYARDGSSERIYYTHAVGLDRTEPRINSLEFEYVGDPKPDKNGSMRYGGGKVIVKGAEDYESGLNEKAYMFGYPKGEWVESNELDARTGSYMIGVRDKVGNVRTDYIRVYYVDSDPPVTSISETDSLSVNGYKRLVDMKVSAEDDTNIPEAFLSLDGSSWTRGDTVEISENGIYEVYTRDVFDHVSKNSIEVKNIDREPPEYSWNIEHIRRGGGFSAEEVLHLIGLDRKAGLGSDAYSYDGCNTWVSENSITVSENGTYPVCVRDALGNEAAVTTVTINDIDDKRPVISNVFETRENTSGIYAGSSVITVEALDEGSGLPDEYVFFEDRPGWSRDNTLAVSRNGVYSFRVRDRVGNIESSSFRVENIDASSPECTIKGNPESLTMSKVTLQLEVKDEISGLKSVYMADRAAGVRKSLAEYPCDADGAGEHKDTIDVEITSNGEYDFYITDMCGNKTEESVTVTKIIKTKTPEKPERPSDDDDDDDKGGGGGGSTPVKERDTKGSGDETVIIGTGSDGKKNNKGGSETGIVVKSGSVSEEKASRSGAVVISENRYSRQNDTDAGMFEEKDGTSQNELTDAYSKDDFSTDIFEIEDEEHYAQNMPQELEMLPDPDNIKTGEEKRSGAGTIALTVVLMVVGLSSLTLFLLTKKGLISLPDLTGKKNPEE